MSEDDLRATWPESGRRNWKTPRDVAPFVHANASRRQEWERRLFGLTLTVHFVEPGRWFYECGAHAWYYGNATTKIGAMRRAEACARSEMRQRHTRKRAKR
jgi:hypothetical protein